MYAQVTVIVNGALESESDFPEEIGPEHRDDPALCIDAFVAGIAREAIADGQQTEVYILWHDHAPEIECECAQYVTDHHPAYAWNTTDDDDKHGIVLWCEQLDEWAGRTLSDAEVARLRKCIPNSSIPEAIATIVASFDDTEAN